MKIFYGLVVFAAVLPCTAYASILNSAGNFAVLAGTTVTNTGATVVKGDLGVSPGTAITGFPPGTVVGTIHSNDGAASQAEADAANAYNFLSGLAFDTTLSNTNLGGLTLTQGVYKYDAAAALNGTLTLSGPGRFVFQIGTGLVVANNAAILLIGGADASNLYFQVGSSETVGTGAALQGTTVALQSISYATGSSLFGRALAINGAVTLQGNSIIISSIPEPGTITLFGTALAVSAFGWLWSRRKTRRQ